MKTFKWIKHRFSGDGDTEYCLVGAILHESSWNKYVEVEKYIMSKYNCHPIGFNDKKSTTLDMINEICEVNGLEFRFV